MVDRVSLMDLAHDVRSIWCPKVLNKCPIKEYFNVYKKWSSPHPLLSVKIVCPGLTLGELVFGAKYTMFSLLVFLSQHITFHR